MDLTHAQMADVVNFLTQFPGIMRGGTRDSEVLIRSMIVAQIGEGVCCEAPTGESLLSEITEQVIKTGQEAFFEELTRDQEFDLVKFLLSIDDVFEKTVAYCNTPSKPTGPYIDANCTMCEAVMEVLFPDWDDAWVEYAAEYANEIANQLPEFVEALLEVHEFTEVAH